MILIVGDTLNPKTNTLVPFKNARCEKRLLSWLSALRLSSDDYRIINSTDLMFSAAKVLALHCNIPIIALGNNASKALRNTPHFKLPHPSGRNRQLNDKSFVSARLNECRRWLNNEYDGD